MKSITLSSVQINELQVNGVTTVFREIVPQPETRLAYCCMGHNYGKWAYPPKDTYMNWGDEYRLPDDISEDELKRVWTLPYQGDDILYVKETWRIWKAHRYDADTHIEYKADGRGTVITFPHGCTDSVNRKDFDNFINKWGVGEKWHPAVSMPCEAARIFVRVTNIRIERLQTIIGVRAEYKINPWVWVMELKQCEDF